jgi:hypothetical protein
MNPVRAARMTADSRGLHRLSSMIPPIWPDEPSGVAPSSPYQAKNHLVLP